MQPAALGLEDLAFRPGRGREGGAIPGLRAIGLPAQPLAEDVHVVQHSDWNESVTGPVKLAWVKANATYHKIPDGNAEGNGTPGFNSSSGEHWDRALGAEKVGNAWRLARDIANAYNGVDDRYLNASIEAGGMDFSDVSESCWIFGFEKLADAGEFFDTFLTQD